MLLGELGYSCAHQHSRPSDIVEVATVSKYYVPSLNSISSLDDLKVFNTQNQCIIYFAYF